MVCHDLMWLGTPTTLLRFFSRLRRVEAQSSSSLDDASSSALPSSR